jgi:hypothetical protein
LNHDGVYQKWINSADLPKSVKLTPTALLGGTLALERRTASSGFEPPPFGGSIGIAKFNCRLA